MRREVCPRSGARIPATPTSSATAPSWSQWFATPSTRYSSVSPASATFQRWSRVSTQHKIGCQPFELAAYSFFIIIGSSSTEYRSYAYFRITLNHFAQSLQSGILLILLCSGGYGNQLHGTEHNRYAAISLAHPRC